MYMERTDIHIEKNIFSSYNEYRKYSFGRKRYAMNRDSQTDAITIPVTLDEKTFRRFACFDTLRLRRRWLWPAVFAAILTAFAVIALLSGKAQSGLIAAVLLSVGLGLPLVYFGTFFYQIHREAQRQKLKPSRRVYTVTLAEDGVHVTNNQKKEAELLVKWPDVKRAWRAKGCIYLYVHDVKAFLLPDGQASVSTDALWDCLNQRMGSAKCKKA